MTPPAECSTGNPPVQAMLFTTRSVLSGTLTARTLWSRPWRRCAKYHPLLGSCTTSNAVKSVCAQSRPDTLPATFNTSGRRSSEMSRQSVPCTWVRAQLSLLLSRSRRCDVWIPAPAASVKACCCSTPAPALAPTVALLGKARVQDIEVPLHSSSKTSIRHNQPAPLTDRSPLSRLVVADVQPRTLASSTSLHIRHGDGLELR